MSIAALSKLALGSFLLALSLAPAARTQPGERARGDELPRSAAGKIDFARLAERFRQQHAVGDGAPCPVDLGTLLEAHFVAAEVGALDLFYPRWCLTERSRWEEFRTLAASAFELQGIWLDWIGASGEGATRARKHLVELEKWVRSARLPSPSSDATGELFGLLGAKPAQTEALAELKKLLRTPEGLGFEPLGSRAPRVLFAPGRLDLIALGSFFGELDTANRAVYWNEAIVGWTEFACVDDVQVVALEYPPLRPEGDEVARGIAMDGREPTGLIEHVAQRLAISLGWCAFGQRLDAALELGLAQALVIELCGQNNTRSGGSGRAGVSAGTEAFIPGGNSAGGALPATNADSRWRGTLGADHFVKPLREAQKAGAKGCAKEKTDRSVWFQLISDAGGERTCVRGPFFGAAASAKELPAPQFLADYLEFFRAYKTAFVHWWRTEAGGKGPQASLRFSELLRRTAGRQEEPPSFEALVRELYGAPLSSPASTSEVAGAEAESLELAFLEWLAKS